MKTDTFYRVEEGEGEGYFTIFLVSEKIKEVGYAFKRKDAELIAAALNETQGL
jgi:hypothetical protein